ncbi:MAG: 2-amino-4-hydroxy-6-hydroxymethyldihydropteridine diphosphokinase [Deltaproteobacteria bacterium]|nr:2-amino-4-hydroxy-6-hydroxymethyldihydropteridine diphosphokinase [Deltaproteobacteria bacterium]
MRAFLGVGSNEGDRWGHLARALRALRAVPGVAWVRPSSVWETAPVGPPQPPYLNAALEAETGLEAPVLLRAMQEIEAAAGRVRRERWGPRTLDLDLLLLGDETVDEPGLRVPHPELARRAFVLRPLAELCPERMVPGAGRSVAALLAACPPQEVRLAGDYPR